MPRLIKPETKLLLSDERWLREQHVDQLISIVDIAKHLEVTPAVVRKALRSFSIVSPSQQLLREAANTRRYGVKNPGMVKEFKEKALSTMVNKFGGHVWSIEGKRHERDATCKQIYGDSNVGKTEYAKQKARQTNVERYGRLHVNQRTLSNDRYALLSDVDWLYDQHIAQQRTVAEIASTLGVTWSTVMTFMNVHNIPTQSYTHKVPGHVYSTLVDADWLKHQNVTLQKSASQIADELGVDPWTVQRHFREAGVPIRLHPHSAGEKEILHFVTTLLPNTQVLNNVRDVINPYELDIYLPEYNLAIEYCGLYWHSSEFKDRLYHQKKLQECNKRGIRLLTIFEDEWVGKQELVKDKIQHVVGKSSKELVYARKTTVCELSSQEKDKFFNQTHIQGTGPGSITYGLLYENHLVAAMAFIRQKNNTYILNRFSTKCRVPGGFEKLLKHFQRTHNWTQLVSFADMRWSDGNLYERTGWTLDGELPVDYYWCKNGKRYHKFGFRHKHLATKLKQYDPTLSETDNCVNNGYTKIYNCGLKRYVLNNGL